MCVVSTSLPSKLKLILMLTVSGFNNVIKMITKAFPFLPSQDQDAGKISVNLLFTAYNLTENHIQ